MNRNSVYPFGETPGIKIPRSKIARPHTLKTTFNHGKLVPIYVSQILPGQTVEMDLNSFIRLSTSVTPVMDDLIADVYFFFVPNRFLWSDFEKFLGANPSGDWTQTTTYTPPKLVADVVTTRKFNPDDVGAYLNLYPAEIKIPDAGNATGAPSSLPLRAYCKVWNDWFRNQNVEKEIPFTTGTSNTVITARSNSFYNDIIMGYGLAPVTKTADVFTRGLPAPQKGAGVRIPTSDTFKVRNATTGSADVQVTPNSSYYLVGTSTLGTIGNIAISSQSMGTINDLRNAFAIQRMLERDARGGTRYIELLKAHFNVSNGDLRLGRSEYLGGKRFGINMNQVVQAGGSPDSTSPTPLGSTAGLSVTGDKSSLFTKSFTEHGWLLGFVVTRIKHHTYSQGINRQFFFNTRYDLYWPELANLGEMAVYTKEIYAGNGSTALNPTTVFNYQEAWYWYRYFPNLLTGYMATHVTGSLNVWHYGDLYSSAPTFTADFEHEENYQLNRTLAFETDDAQEAHNYIADFFFNEKDVLPMPLYSIPGLVDHI